MNARRPSIVVAPISQRATKGREEAPPGGRAERKRGNNPNPKRPIPQTSDDPKLSNIILNEPRQPHSRGGRFLKPRRTSGNYLMRLTREKLHWLYETMYRIRRFEETMLEQTFRGNAMGVTHPSDGQEAVPDGHLRPPHRKRLDRLHASRTRSLHRQRLGYQGDDGRDHGTIHRAVQR